MSTRLPDDGQPEFQPIPRKYKFWLDLFIAGNLAAGLISLAVRCSVGAEACASLSVWT